MGKHKRLKKKKAREAKVEIGTVWGPAKTDEDPELAQLSGGITAEEAKRVLEAAPDCEEKADQLVASLQVIPASVETLKKQLGVQVARPREPLIVQPPTLLSRLWRDRFER